MTADKGMKEDLGGGAERQALCSDPVQRNDTRAAPEGNFHSGYPGGIRSDIHELQPFHGLSCSCARCFRLNATSAAHWIKS